MEPLVQTKLTITNASVLQVSKGMIAKKILTIVQTILVETGAYVEMESIVIAVFVLQVSVGRIVSTILTNVQVQTAKTTRHVLTRSMVSFVSATKVSPA